MEYHNRGRKQINLMPKLFAMMNKKQTNSAILAGIAISAILVTSSLIIGSQLSQQAFAQAPPSPTPRPTPKPTQSAAASNPAATPIGKNVVLSGTVASTISPLAGHGKEQVAILLPLRKDGAVYTGVLTFTASKGVQVELWHEVTGVSPSTPIPKQFGAIPVSVSPNGKGIISTALVPSSSTTSGSIPFTGNAVALHGSSSPFIATYSVTAQTSQPQTMNNVTSATAAATLGGAAGATLGGAAAAPALGGAAGGTSGGTSGGDTGTSGGDTGTSGGG
jgi:hypothetical protein